VDYVARLQGDGIQFNVGMLESDPIVKLAETCAFRELIWRKRTNDCVKAILLPTSYGTNIDNVGALVNTKRLGIGEIPSEYAIGSITFGGNFSVSDTIQINGVVITFVVSTPRLANNEVLIGTSITSSMSNLLVFLGTTQNDRLLACTYTGAGAVLTMTAVEAGSIGNNIVLAANVAAGAIVVPMSGGIDEVPGIPELDDDYRSRIQLAPETYSVAGPAGAYEYFARQVLGPDGAIDASAIMLPGDKGRVTLTVLMGNGVYTPTQAQMIKLLSWYQQNSATPLTDYIAIQGPNILRVNIDATLTLYPGPSNATVLAACSNAVAALVAKSSNKLGTSFSKSQLYAALQQPGVFSVTINSPTTDLDFDRTQVIQVLTTNLQVAPLRIPS